MCDETSNNPEIKEEEEMSFDCHQMVSMRNRNQKRTCHSARSSHIKCRTIELVRFLRSIIHSIRLYYFDSVVVANLRGGSHANGSPLASRFLLCGVVRNSYV